MSVTSNNLQGVRSRIRAAVEAAQRGADSVELIAVTKTFSSVRVLEAIAAGQSAFGENYVQEGIGKIAEVDETLGPASTTRPVWHFIGPIQSNKTRAIAAHFDWVHGVDRARIAERLSAQRGMDRGPLDVLIEVNIDREASKGGVLPEDALPLAEAVAGLPRLRLRGLMAIPAVREDVGEQRRAFARVRALLETLRARGFDCDQLSMGMSADLEAAIAEGATMVRVGTAIFGTRTKPLSIEETP